MENINETMKLDEEFIELYPDVTIEDIPEEVFERAETDGIPLVATYALYHRKLFMAQRKIEEFNKKNSEKSPGKIKHDGVSEKLYTLDQIKRMAPVDVAKNYDQIMKSLENLNKNK